MMNEREELLVRARRLAPLIESRALAAEEDKTLTSDVVEALRASELFWMLVPRELGGLDVDIATYIDVVEEVACADGSTGWTLMANAVGLGLAASYLGDSAVERMFGAGKRPIIAAVGAPNGTAQVREGGFVTTSGRWKFGSGCAHSEWIGAGFRVLEGEQPKLGAGGVPESRLFFLPGEKVEIIRQWNVSGLLGTGSFEFVVPEQEVDEAFTFDMTEVRRGRHFQNFGAPGVASASHAAVALGMAKRALQEIATLAATRRRGGPGIPVYLLGENPLFRSEFAESDAAYRSVRALLHESYRDAETGIRSRGCITDAEDARLTQAMVSAHYVARDVVRRCWQWAGSDGITRPSALERVFRDMHVAVAHAIADKSKLAIVAPSLLAAHREERERTSRGELERGDRGSAE